MLNQPNYKPLQNYGLTSPIRSANAHAIREAGRLIYNADHRVKTDMRISRPRKNARLSPQSAQTPPRS